MFDIHTDSVITEAVPALEISADSSLTEVLEVLSDTIGNIISAIDDLERRIDKVERQQKK